MLIPSFYIGWDVGGWNCDNNANSRDALVILDADLGIIGKPWRGNLRAIINEASSGPEWIQKLFALCNSTSPNQARYTLAIDTPLGFSDAFVGLITQQQHLEKLGRSGSNSYLYRRTEQCLFERGLKPLSAIKDMIGSQATKGMHVLAKFAIQAIRCGVWSDDNQIVAIEAYPSSCKNSASVTALQKPYGKLGHEDIDDALTCALIAFLFDTRNETLLPPLACATMSEGWIWVPNDGLLDDMRKKHHEHLE